MGVRQSIFTLSCVLACATLGCSKGWQLDYGKPSAQFVSKSIAVKGAPFIGKKITVKGRVVKVDTSNPEAALIYLENSIQCNLGGFTAMANGCTVGDVIYVDGFLARCEEGRIVLEPALIRDPTAPFSPTQ
jgi:hypothetical protein